MTSSRTVSLLLVATFLITIGLSGVVQAQDLSVHKPRTSKEFDFYARGPYRSGAPRPEDVLGYKLGSRETTFWQQERVVRALAEAAPDRLKYIQYGETPEGRPLRILVISSPEN